VPIPDLCAMSLDSLTMRTRGTGYTLSSNQEPSEVTSNEIGQCSVKFDRRMYSPAIQFDLYWDGASLDEVPAPRSCDDPQADPGDCIRGIGIEYTVEVIVRADGSHEVFISWGYQMWWCGEEIGYCRPGTTDAYFSPECIQASRDPEYLKLYQPGTGPACTMGRYYKECNNCPVVKLD